MLSACYYQWRALDQYDQSDDAAVKLELMNKWLERVDSYPDLGPVTRAHERRRPNAPYVGDQKPTISALIDGLFPSEDGRHSAGGCMQLSVHLLTQKRTASP